MIGNHTLLVQPLAKSQPLAYRLLSSILVQCPLRLTGVPCSWRGDYGDLQSHLLSSTAHTDNSTEPQQHRTEQLALSLKEEANQKFESRHFSEAKSLYTKAIEVLQQEQLHEVESALLSTLYSNRAATHLQLQDYNQCLEDCQYIIQNIPNTDSNNNIKVYIRAIRASIQLGDLNQASNYVTLGLEEHPQHSSLVKNQGIITQLVQMYAQGNHQLQSQQYATAKATFGKLLAESPSAISFLLGAAQADLGLGLTESAIRLTKRVLMKHAQNPRGCWIRGQAVFLMGDAKVGIQLLQEALRLDPDCEEIKLSFKLAKKVDRWLMAASKQVFSRQFQPAVESLTSCLQAYQHLPSKCPLYATIYTKRAEAYLRLKHYKESLKDCAIVLYAQEDHIPAWLIRFQAHHGLQDHATALEEVKEVVRKFSLDQDRRLQQAYERADFLLRKQRRVDFYQLMGVPSIASVLEIKKAYKKKALELHPDRVAPQDQDQARKQFQLLGEALEILSDDFQRKLYDEGYDPAAIRERVEAAKQAAHNHRHHSHYR